VKGRNRPLDRGNLITTGGIRKLRKRPDARLPKLKQNSENMDGGPASRQINSDRVALPCLQIGAISEVFCLGGIVLSFSESVPSLTNHSRKVRTDQTA
jgi:hypothetical protein